MRKLLLIPAVLLAVATPVSAQSFLKKLGDRLSERMTTAVTSGQLPRLPSAAAGGASSSTGFQRYGAWDFKLERLEKGADDAWQAVIAVRNAANYRQGMVASEINLFLITEDALDVIDRLETAGPYVHGAIEIVALDGGATRTAQAYLASDPRAWQALVARGRADPLARYPRALASEERRKPCCVRTPGHPPPHEVIDPL